jgi:hypothetical protein
MVRMGRLTEEQGMLLDELTALIRGELGQGMDPYPGEIIPPADALQQRAFSWAEGLDPESASQQARESSLMDMVMGKPSFERTPETEAELERYYQEAFVGPGKAAHQDELDVLAERYAGAGMNRSGSFADALGRSTTDYWSQLQGQKAGLMRGDIQDERAARESAAGRVMPGAEALAREESRVPTLWAQAGQARRGIDRELASEGVYDWLISQPAYNPWLGYMGLGLNTPAFQFGTESESFSVQGAVA